MRANHKGPSRPPLPRKDTTSQRRTSKQDTTKLWLLEYICLWSHINLPLNLTWLGCSVSRFFTGKISTSSHRCENWMKCCQFIATLQLIKSFLLLFHLYVRSFGCTQKEYMKGGASKWSYFGKQLVEWNSKGYLMSGEIPASAFHPNALHC